MNVDVRIKGKSTRAMVDMVTTHKFIVDAEVQLLSLKLEKDLSKMKAIIWKLDTFLG